MDLTAEASGLAQDAVTPATGMVIIRLINDNKIEKQTTNSYIRNININLNCKLSFQNDNKNNKKNKSKRRFEEIDESDDQCERPKAKKLLKIINTASGQFIEEPMTPEKQNRHGFQGKMTKFPFKIVFLRSRKVF